jgi:hypothetical protein
MCGEALWAGVNGVLGPLESRRMFRSYRLIVLGSDVERGDDGGEQSEAPVQEGGQEPRGEGEDVPHRLSSGCRVLIGFLSTRALPSPHAGRDAGVLGPDQRFPTRRSPDRRPGRPCATPQSSTLLGAVTPADRGPSPCRSRSRQQDRYRTIESRVCRRTGTSSRTCGCRQPWPCRRTAGRLPTWTTPTASSTWSSSR